MQVLNQQGLAVGEDGEVIYRRYQLCSVCGKVKNAAESDVLWEYCDYCKYTHCNQCRGSSLATFSPSVANPDKLTIHRLWPKYTGELNENGNTLHSYGARNDGGPLLPENYHLCMRCLQEFAGEKLFVMGASHRDSDLARNQMKAVRKEVSRRWKVKSSVYRVRQAVANRKQLRRAHKRIEELEARVDEFEMQDTPRVLAPHTPNTTMNSQDEIDSPHTPAVNPTPFRDFFGPNTSH